MKDHFRQLAGLSVAMTVLAVIHYSARAQGFTPFDSAGQTNLSPTFYHTLHWEQDDIVTYPGGDGSTNTTIGTVIYAGQSRSEWFGKVVDITSTALVGDSYFETNEPAGVIIPLPDMLKFGDGLYYRWSESLDDEIILNMYLDGEDVSDYWPNCVVTVAESDSSKSYQVTITSAFNDGNGNPVKTTTTKRSMSLDGAFNAHEDRDGLDHGKACQCTAMPVWFVTEPYLNLWVKDAPVSYMTSLGQPITFELAYKQRDTRPNDTNTFVPVTGWGHNWFSYMRCASPRYVSGVDVNNTNTAIVGMSGRGVAIRSFWILTNDVTQWQAIVYAPDTSEYYFDYVNDVDSDSGSQLLGGNSGTLRIVNTNNPAGWDEVGSGGYRLVHPDGSQDYYVIFTNYTQPIWGEDDIGGRRSFRTVRPDQIRDELPGTYDQTWSESDPASYTYSSENIPTGPIDYYLSDALMTDRVDPYGNKISLIYATDGTNYYLSQLIDYDGNPTTLTYTNGNVSRVDMPYGKSAIMQYDSNGNLSQITDAAGMSSTIQYASYGTNFYVSQLTTPYGTTTFAHTEAPSYAVFMNRVLHLHPGTLHSTNGPTFDSGSQQVTAYCGRLGAPDCVNRSCLVMLPDSSQELYAYRFDSSRLLATSNAVPNCQDSGIGNVMDAWISSRNSFHWNRMQVELVPRQDLTNLNNLTASDLVVSTRTHWLGQQDEFQTTLSEIASFVLGPTPDGIHQGQFTWFEYSGQNQWIAPTSLSGPADETVSRLMPDGSTPRTSIKFDLGRPSSITEDYTGGQRTFSYNYSNVIVDWGNNDYQSYTLLSSVTTPSSGTWTLNVPSDASGGTLMLTITDPVGNVTKDFYNRRMQLTGVVRPDGSSLTNIYDGSGFLMTRVEQEAQSTNTFSFANGVLHSRVTPLGLTLNYSWDKLDRLTQIAFPDGTTISNNYYLLDIVGHKDRLNQWTQAQYDHMRQMYRSTDANGNTARYTWCSCGALEHVTDPFSSTTAYTRDNIGNVTAVTNSDGSWMTYVRDNLGRVTQASSSDGLNLTYEYNIQGLVTRVSNPAGAVFQAVYDAEDRIVYQTDAAGFTVANSYDGLGRLLTRQDAVGSEQFTYDNHGLALYVDAMHRTNSYGYDPAGRLASITNANNEVTQFGYNPLGQMTSLKDGRNHTKQWTFDNYGRQIAEINANGVLVRTNSYDVDGQLTSKWTAAKGLTQFAYDANGNVTSIVRPLSGSISYGYDKLNRLTSVIDPLGATALAYVNFGAFRGALASEDGPWNNDTVAYSYTGHKLTSIGLSSWTENIGYDDSLRPCAFANSADTFTYSFNGAGMRLASLTLPGTGNVVNYGYSLRGDVSSIQLTHNGSIVDSHVYDRDASGLITKVTRANSSWVDYGYDPAGQLASAVGHEADYTLRANENFGYGYDASGNLSSRTNNTLLQTFTSDSVNQLAQITRNNQLTVAGNVTSQPDSLTINGQNVAIYSDLTYATPNGVAITDGQNTFSVAITQGTTNTTRSTTMMLPQSLTCAYDLNGNLISDGQRSYAYDDDNQLIRIISTNGWKSEFSYDGLGRRRVRKEYTWVPTAANWQLTNETHYVYDGMVVLQERDGNNNVLVTYTRGLDLSGGRQGAGGIGGLLARTDSGGSAYYHSDAGGNITSMVDSSGNVVARYLYDPYGNLLSKSGALADANTYRFSSKEVHPNSGIYYYGFRYYEPNLQRWLNEDPIGESGGVNLFGFTANDPMYWVDPLGLCDDWLWMSPDGKVHTSMPPSEQPRPDPNAVSWGSRNYGDITDGQRLGDFFRDDFIKPVAKNSAKNGVQLAMMVPLGEEEAVAESGGGLLKWLKNFFKKKPCPTLTVAPWVKDAGSFVKFAENLEKEAQLGKELSPKQLDEFVELAKKYGVDLRADPPHGGTPWNMPHLNVGKAGAHVPFPPTWTPPSWIPRGDLPVDLQ